MRKLYFFIAILFLVSVFFSFILIKYEPVNSSFLRVLDVLSAIQVIITVYLVFLVYDRFGTSKKLLDKQNDLVIEYVEELKKVQLYIHSQTNDGFTERMYLSVSKKLLHDERSELDELVNKRVMFESEEFYTDLKRINEIISHPLFPIGLKKKVNVFRFSSLTGKPTFDKTKYALVSFSGTDKFDKGGWMYPEDGTMTLANYLARLEKLVGELEQWINKETSIKIKLNF